MLALALPAREEEVFEVLWKELPSARKISGDEPTGANPILNCPDAHLEYLGDVAIAIHRLEGQILDGENRFQQRVSVRF